MHPLVILNDSRCAPTDTPLTWALKVLWPRALANPEPLPETRTSKDSTITMAKRWALTQHYLRLAHPHGLACKACGAADTPDNPLLWGNPEIAKAHGVRIPPPDTRRLFFAQNADWASGDTDIALIGYSTQAPMVYCLACTIGLSTRVANVLLRPHLAFYWTPQHEALPWDRAPALWELPPERPLIVRPARGPGENNEKWLTTLTITWDPAVITVPAVDRKTMRGAFPIALPVDRVRAWPSQFRAWLATQKATRQPSNKDAFKSTLFPLLFDTVPPPFRFKLLGLKHEALYDALKYTIEQEDS